MASAKPAPTNEKNTSNIDMEDLQMEEFLAKANMIAKAAFTEWLPMLANADLGAIGTIATGLTFFGIAITIYQKWFR